MVLLLEEEDWTGGGNRKVEILFSPNEAGRVKRWPRE